MENGISQSLENRAKLMLHMVNATQIKKNILKNTSTQKHIDIEREERDQYSFFVRTKLFDDIMTLNGTKI